MEYFRATMSDVIRASIKKLDEHVLESRVGEIPCFTLYF